MPKLYSTKDDTFLRIIDKSERELNAFICEKWKSIFPQYTFIKSEFSLNGSVRSATGNGGRIDILAYNPETKRFVIFELKKDYDRNITDQAADYRDFMQDNYANIYLQATQDYHADLPVYSEIQTDKVEIVLIAKHFSHAQLERVKGLNKKANLITLIRYFWFEDNLIFIDYVNNDPEEKKVEATNTRKLNAIKAIVMQDGPLADAAAYFGMFKASEELFYQFYQYLKGQAEEPEITAQSSKLKVTLPRLGETFSVIKHAGKGGRRALLQINTDIDITGRTENLQIDDRIRPGKKKKGSLGIERYEVFICNEKDMDECCSLIHQKFQV